MSQAAVPSTLPPVRPTNRFEQLQGVPLVEKMAFTRHLALMIKAGFSLPQALTVLMAQTSHRYFKEIIAALESRVRRGETFSASLAAFPTVFSNLYTNMVRVGEASGTLEEVLGHLAEQLRKEHELKSRVVGALMYPAVIMVAMVLVGIFMLIFVLPKITQTLKDLGAPLPFTTQVIVSVSDWVAGHVLLFFFIIAAMAIGGFRLFKARRVKRTIAWLGLRLPILKKLTRELNAARVARTMGSLLSSGLPLIESLEITAQTVQNPFYREALRQVAAVVPKGEKMAGHLARFPQLFPPIITQMVGVGEETGALTDILKTLADFYEAEVDTATKNLGALLEPILLIFIGIAVGFFVVSMLMPMFSVYGKI